MKGDQPRTGYSATVPLLVGLVCLYFLCPYAYLSPFILIGGKHWRPSGVIMACFWPVISLASYSPTYAHFLNEEEHLLGLS